MQIKVRLQSSRELLVPTHCGGHCCLGLCRGSSITLHVALGQRFIVLEQPATGQSEAQAENLERADVAIKMTLTLGGIDETEVRNASTVWGFRASLALMAALCLAVRQHRRCDGSPSRTFRVRPVVAVQWKFLVRQVPSIAVGHPRVPISTQREALCVRAPVTRGRLCWGSGSGGLVPSRSICHACDER